MIITLIGRPLAGKETISLLTADIFGGQTILYIMPIKVRGRYIMNHHVVVTTCYFEKQSFSLECMHGAGFMEEAYEELLPRGDIFIWVFDSQKVRFESQCELWKNMQPLIKPEKLYFIINKQDIQPIKFPKDFLNSYGIYIDRPTIQISATFPSAVEPLKNFIINCLRENTY